MLTLILKIILVINLFAFVIGEVTRIPILPAGVRLLDITVLATFFLWVLKLKLDNNLKLLYKPSILLFLIICLLSLAINSIWLSTNQLFSSFLYLIRFASFAALLSLVSNYDNSFKGLTKKTLFISGGLVVLIGYVQYFLYPNLRNLYYLGWDEHLFRMFSVFLDPNFAGAFFVLYFLYLLDEVFEGIKDKTSLFLHYFFLAITVPSIYLTYSRSALLMFILGICVFLVIKKKAIWIGAVLIIILSLTLFAPKSFRTEGTNLLRVASSEARIQSSKEAFGVFIKSPIFGVGFNSYRFAREKLGIRTSELSHADSSTDNSFLFILATTGVLGLTAFGYMLFSLLKEYKSKPLVVSSLISLILNSMFINSLFYSFLLFWVFLIMGIKESKKP